MVCKLLASASCVCRGFRSALLGPGADALWPFVVLSASHPGLTARQSRGLNRMLAAQGHRAASVDLTGGGWDLDELRTVLASLTGLSDWMTIWNIHSAQEAAIISRTLSTRPIKLVDYEGTAACILPVTAQKVKILVTPGPPPKVHGNIDQAALQRFVGCLRPLRDLRVLRLRSVFWQLKEADVLQWVARHPHLEELHLTMGVIRNMGLHAIASLRLLSAVQLTLILISNSPGSLVPMLQQLPGLQLEDLVLVAGGLSCAEDALLARCSMRALCVNFPDPAQRLRHPPPGVPMYYDGEEP